MLRLEGAMKRFGGKVAVDKEERATALSALDQLGIATLAAQRAATLAGGQQQRVAIARALVRPRMLVADEPIASLDPHNTKVAMGALLRINKHFGITILCNLHSNDTARSYSGRLIGMAEGRLLHDGAPSDLTDSAVRELYELEAGDVMDPSGIGTPPIDEAFAAVAAR